MMEAPPKLQPDQPVTTSGELGATNIYEREQRNWQVMDRLRRGTAWLKAKRQKQAERRRQEQEARHDNAGKWLVMLIASMAVNVAAKEEPTATRRRTKRQQMIERIRALRFRTGV
jgi:hypothetical protein